MTTIDITATELVVRLSGWDRLWALKRKLTIPLAHVRGAAVDPEAKDRFAGIRLPGSHVPGVVTAGTFRWRKQWWFWSVRKRENVIVVDLENERYAQLVLEVEDPEATVAAIERAIADRSA